MKHKKSNVANLLGGSVGAWQSFCQETTWETRASDSARAVEMRGPGGLRPVD